MISADTLNSPFMLGFMMRRILASIAPSLNLSSPGFGACALGSLISGMTPLPNIAAPRQGVATGAAWPECLGSWVGRERRRNIIKLKVCGHNMDENLQHIMNKQNVVQEGYLGLKNEDRS